MNDTPPTGISDASPADPSADEVNWDGPSQAEMDDVRQLFNSLSKAVRAHQLYDENNPVYQRFVLGLQAELRKLWDWLDRLAIQVDEDRLLWLDTEVYQTANRADSLAFLFYKDGVREIVFKPGIEDGELPRLLGVIHRARNLRPESDDLLTILWDEDLQFFDYHHVDILAEGATLPVPGEGADRSALQQALREEAADQEGAEDGEEEEGREREDRTADGASGRVRTEDFNPTLYSLDPKELARLREQVEEEMHRDLRRAVLAALFDRLEEPGNRDRQSQIIAILQTLLPNFLSRGALRPAAAVLHELSSLRERDGVLDEARQQEADQLLEEVSAPDTIREMVRSLRDGSIEPDSHSLGVFVRFLKPKALASVIWAAETEEDEEVQGVLRESVQSLADAHRETLIALLDDDDPLVVAGAARLAGAVGAKEATGKLGQLFEHDLASVRLAAVEAAVSLRASGAAAALEAALEDPDRDVRIAAARGLGTLRYPPAASRFREVLKGKAIRQADVTEMIAFFESYAQIGDPQAVSLLDGFLNGKGFLGRKESEDVRACAALALGRVRTPEARRALDAARDQEEPVVRSAVSRAIRALDSPEEEA